MKQLILVLFFFQAFGADAQKFLIAVIVSENDHKPLPYSTIKTSTGREGTFSDEEGRFWINVNDTDTLFISSIGYISTKTLVAHLKDTVFLILNPKVLQEVIVKPKTFVKTLTAGIRLQKEDLKWGPSRSDDEFAQKLILPVDTQYIYKIKSVSLPVHKFQGNIPVLLHIYLEDPQTHLPGEDILLTKYLIQKSNYKKGKIIIDLSDKNLYADCQVIFISFEWLGSVLTGKKLDIFSETAISMTYSLKDTLTYRKVYGNNQIVWSPLITRNQKTEKIRPLNTMFSIELEVYK